MFAFLLNNNRCLLQLPCKQVNTLETSVIFVNENENGEKRENNEFVNKN